LYYTLRIGTVKFNSVGITTGYRNPYTLGIGSVRFDSVIVTHGFRAGRWLRRLGTWASLTRRPVLGTAALVDRRDILETRIQGVYTVYTVFHCIISSISREGAECLERSLAGSTYVLWAIRSHCMSMY